jgi:hypothetical protein
MRPSIASSATHDLAGDLVERNFARLYAREIKHWLRTTVEGLAARGCRNRQRELVWQDLLAIEDGMRIHGRTSRDFPTDNTIVPPARGFSAERGQLLLNLMKAREPVVRLCRKTPSRNRLLVE